MKTERLRVAVVGGGLIAQAVHLPNLRRLSDLFELCAIADPSRKVREALSARYAPARAYADWRELLERERLDALAICSPQATHAAIILAALELGLHVFVEKPLCIAVEDGEAIVAAAERVGRVVQVGYMKRHSAAYDELIAALPGSAETLRKIDVVTYDPWLSREPFVPWSEMVQGDDVPADVRAAGVADERRQVEQAVGSGDSGAVRAYCYLYLDCLVHDINLVHGALEALGVELPLTPVGGRVWADGNAASVTLTLPSGSPWHCTWMLLPGLASFCEDVSLLFDDAAHRLQLPAPYLVDEPIVRTLVDTAGGRRRTRTYETVDDPFLTELRRFHASVTEGAPCRTPARQGVLDVATLRDLFRASGA
jgi:predicted dehydrogenase